ncbi:MAG: response regulator [Thermodesulfobacteriota bacterium]
MSADSLLKDKHVLAVDDEPDILDIVEEELDMCMVRKAQDYETAMQLLASYTFDIVILDIMGVNGFELLRESVSRGFPTVMLTAHALSAESLKKSIKLGAVSFLPKEKIPELRSYLEDVVLGGGRPVWKKLFDRMSSYFAKRFGPDWQERDEFFQDFVEQLKKEGIEEQT